MKQKELIYKKTQGLSPFAYAVVGEWLYFCDQCIKALFRYHFNKEKCEFVVKFEDKSVNQNFYKICAYEEELWMLPFSDGKIVCFNRRNEKLSYYDIPEVIKEKRIPFIDIFFWREKAYIVPHGNNRYLIVIDLETRNMSEIKLMREKQEKCLVAFLGAVQINNHIFLAESTENILIKFDVDNNDINIMNIKGYELEGAYPKFFENEIWFVPVNSKKNILLFNEKFNCFKEKEYPIKGLAENEVCLFMICENTMWFLANKNKKIYRLNRNMKIEEEITISNFNEDEKILYISGMLFNNQFFWHGHTGTPLIWVKDDDVRILDVGKGKRLLEVYLETLIKRNIYKNTFGKLKIGEHIYYSTK